MAPNRPGARPGQPGGGGDRRLAVRYAERGQTTNEYLMIVGLMAAVIVVVFVVVYWDAVNHAMRDMVWNVWDALVSITHPEKSRASQLGSRK
jgi:hypothetical protein